MADCKYNIVLIRHAQTAFGESERFMGTLDIPCSITGLVNAKKAQTDFMGIEFNLIYTSPLKRARQTAEILFPNYQCIIDSKLIERNLGEWAGMDLQTAKTSFPDGFYPSGVINPYYTPKCGETIENLVSRVSLFLVSISEIFKSHSQKHQQSSFFNIGIISHNGVIRVVRCLLENRPLSEMFNQNEIHLKPIIFRFTGASWQSVSDIRQAS